MDDLVEEEGPAGLPKEREARSDRASVAARLGVHGDFMRVPALARALGISQNTVHAQMRSGAFPIPHRRVGNVIVIKLDDYIAWLAGRPIDSRKTHDPGELDPKALNACSGRESDPKEVAARMKRNARAAMIKMGFTS